jgi:CDP-glucose 4,6-dehydratase
MTTNVIGTMNLLEILRDYSKECIVIFVTSDKCYDNVEWEWGYRETDPLGGKDIYSGSKAAAELIIKSYTNTFFNQNHPVKIGIGRAGNVIGGGDWAKDRIIVDAILAWSKNEPVTIRAPKSTRPWQHVLEPLSGYLHLASTLKFNSELHGEAYNFGPRSEQNKSVKELIFDISEGWNLSNEKSYNIIENNDFNESRLLKLNCDKALYYLKWESNFKYEETAKNTSEWYREYYLIKSNSMFDITLNQINSYCKLAEIRNRIWTKN